jgi:hypothetical protein
MSEPGPCPFEQRGAIPTGSVLACLGPDNEIWLAQTYEEVSVEDVRWKILWLQEVKSSQHEGTTYKLANTGVSMTWHDCVLSDVTKYVKEMPKGTWLLPVDIKEKLLQMANDQDGNDAVDTNAPSISPDNHQLNLVLPSTPSAAESTQEQISESEVSLLVSLCLDAISMVSDDITFKDMHVLFICFVPCPHIQGHACHIIHETFLCDAFISVTNAHLHNDECSL